MMRSQRKDSPYMIDFFEEYEDNFNMVLYSRIDAHITFMRIHLEFYPLEVQKMLRHMEIVKAFHMTNKKVIEYDCQFRCLKSVSSDTVRGEY